MLTTPKPPFPSAAWGAGSAAGGVCLQRTCTSAAGTPGAARIAVGGSVYRPASPFLVGERPDGSFEPSRERGEDVLGDGVWCGWASGDADVDGEQLFERSGEFGALAEDIVAE